MKPTIKNSNTKLGAVISFVFTMLIIFLPEFGVQLQDTLIQKILYAIDGLGILLSVFGLRDAIHKNIAEAKSLVRKVN